MQGLFLQILFLSLYQIQSLIPYPKEFNQGSQVYTFSEKCALEFDNISQFPGHIQFILNHYKDMIQANAGCDTYQKSDQYQKSWIVATFLDSCEQIYSISNTDQEEYHLDIYTNFTIRIIAKTHWGLIRALNSLEQLLSPNIFYLPIQIYDKPDHWYRGIMIDSARNFLSVSLIQQTIDAMMLNSLNTLHWHITDDESFPLLLSNHSHITHFGKYSDTSMYTSENIYSLTNYASIRGVQIIPEIDTPAHTLSWGNSPTIREMILFCSNSQGQLDPTLAATYGILESIMLDLHNLFNHSNYIHFGGDEAINDCFTRKPQIQEFMKENGINTYNDLQEYYRKKQKSIWINNIKSKQRVIYWFNEREQLSLDENDIIQWWGEVSRLSSINQKHNDVILSYYHPLYLDIGVGNAFGDKYQEYQTWKDIYQVRLTPPSNFQGKIIGAIAPLWGETNNEQTHFQKLFPRASVLADILWNSNRRNEEPFSQFARRLGYSQDRMLLNKFNVTPYTSQYCRKYPEMCFTSNIIKESSENPQTTSTTTAQVSTSKLTKILSSLLLGYFLL